MFDQFIDPANLALLSSEQQRTIILLLAHPGLRVSSIVTLDRRRLRLALMAIRIAFPERQVQA